MNSTSGPNIDITQTSESCQLEQRQELTNLGIYRFILKKPFPYVVEEQEGDFIAYTGSPICEYGHGKTKSEAIADLQQNLIEYYFVLKGYEAKLGKEPKREFRWLEKYMVIVWNSWTGL